MSRKQTFEDYLMEKHAEQYIGVKDNMIDDYFDWSESLSVDELIEYADKWGEK